MTCFKYVFKVVAKKREIEVNLNVIQSFIYKVFKGFVELSKQ